MKKTSIKRKPIKKPEKRVKGKGGRTPRSPGEGGATGFSLGGKGNER